MKNRTPLDILVGEHKEAKAIVKILNTLSGNLAKKKSVSLLYLKDFVSVINSFLESHHKKEMEVFPFLVKNEKIGRSDLIDVLKEEHQLGYEFLANIMQIINHKKKDPAEKYELLPFHMRQYAELLKAHIEKEEHGFFPMMKAYLSEKENIGLGKEFEKIEAAGNNRKNISFIHEAGKWYLL